MTVKRKAKYANSTHGSPENTPSNYVPLSLSYESTSPLEARVTSSSTHSARYDPFRSLWKRGRNYVKTNICFMSHHQEELVPTQLQKRKPQEQLPECEVKCIEFLLLSYWSLQALATAARTAVSGVHRSTHRCLWCAPQHAPLSLVCTAARTAVLVCTAARTAVSRTSLSMNSKDPGTWPAHDQLKAPEDTGKELYKIHSSYKQDSEKGSGAPENSLANQRNGQHLVHKQSGGKNTGETLMDRS
ncbi:hypothetical protein U0070_017929 [Myodes glareolus]|uniref:Uncharacterized protein n=1 Tax=Myodes glareolus TaxID=447135 RepID=A0AAW0K901_MYOGA